MEKYGGKIPPYFNILKEENMKTILLLLGNVLFNALANILMKQSAISNNNIKVENLNTFIRYIVFNPIFLIGCFCYGISLLFYTFVLRSMRLSMAYPIVVSGSIILVTLFSLLLFKENIKPIHYVGFIVAMLGIYLVMR